MNDSAPVATTETPPGSDKSIALTLPCPQQFLRDILTIATDVGGVGYWMGCDRIVRDANHEPERIVAPYDCEAEDNGEGQFPERWPDVTLDTVRLGIERLLLPELKVRNDIAGTVYLALLTEDAGMIDVECADSIVQIGMFGKLVYG